MLIIKTEEDRERCTSCYGNHTIELTMEEALWQKSNPKPCSTCVTANAAAIGATIPIAGTPQIFLMLSIAEPFQMDMRK